MKGKGWKTAFVVFLIAWALYEITPPGRKNLIDVFEKEAATSETATAEALESIVTEARSLDEAEPERTYQNLEAAIGETDITPYFPEIEIDRVRGATSSVLFELEKKAAGQIQLGLDLRGGSSFVVKVGESDDESVQVDDQRITKAIEVLRKRVDGFGVAEPIILPIGDDRISIQLPGLTQAAKESAREQIQKPAVLEFRLVNPESARHLADDVVPPLHEKLFEYRIDPTTGLEYAVPYIVERESAGGLGGEHLRSAFVQPDMVGAPTIILNFNTEGARIFGEVTTANVGNQLAIVLDGEIQSAPNINQPITGGSAEISGDYTYESATDLANVLENPLETPVEIIQENSVDPSLGADSIASGIRACLAGAAVVLVFMTAYYAFAGAIASVAMCFNVLLLLGMMTSLDATLTLPGIAGIVLTIGMAVDANVMIFERIREELKDGKSLRHAINSGYDKAFSTIIDANITTLIASVILMKLGSGPVQGFGTTLTFGIIASIITAIIVTRLLFEALLAAGVMKSFKMFSLIKDVKIDFLTPSLRKYAAIGSTALFVVAIAGTAVLQGDVRGIDFKGGDRLILSFDNSVKPNTGDIRDALTEGGVADASVQFQSATTVGGEETLGLITPFEQGESAVAALQASFPEAEFELSLSDAAGPSVGADILKLAIISAALATFGILFYVALRFEFSFAIGAIIALAHDVLLTLGIFLLLGGKLNAPIVAALLTIFGFSINDTIVIFDRIREELKLGRKGSFRQIINGAINQTLSRTIITSGTTLLATLCLFVLGGAVIRDFALTFLIGIVVGTYSSIYVASSSVLLITKGQKPTLYSAPTETDGLQEATA